MVRQSVQNSAGQPDGTRQIRGLPVVRGQAGRRSGTVRGGCDFSVRRSRDRRQDGHGPAQGRPNVGLGNVLQKGCATVPASETLCFLSTRIILCGHNPPNHAAI